MNELELLKEQVKQLETQLSVFKENELKYQNQILELNKNNSEITDKFSKLETESNSLRTRIDIYEKILPNTVSGTGKPNNSQNNNLDQSFNNLFEQEDPNGK